MSSNSTIVTTHTVTRTTRSVTYRFDQQPEINARTLLPALENVLSQNGIGLYPTGIQSDAEPHVIQYGNTPEATRNPPLLHAPWIHPKRSPAGRFFSKADGSARLEDPFAKEYWRLQELVDRVPEMLKRRDDFSSPRLTPEKGALEYLAIAARENDPEVKFNTMIIAALFMSHLEGEGADRLANQVLADVIEASESIYTKALLEELQYFISLKSLEGGNRDYEWSSQLSLHLAYEEDSAVQDRYGSLLLHQAISICGHRNSWYLCDAPMLFELSQKYYLEHGRPDLAAEDAMRAAWTKICDIHNGGEFDVQDAAQIIDLLDRAATQWNTVSPDSELSLSLGELISKTVSFFASEIKTWDLHGLDAYISDIQSESKDYPRGAQLLLAALQAE